MKVKFKKTSKDSKLPVKGNDKAACYDVYAHWQSNDYVEGKVTIGLGFSTEIPEGYKMVAVPRSNLSKYNWIINNSPCQIDQDFRGEWLLIFTPIPTGVKKRGMSGDYKLIFPDFPYEMGERVAQIHLQKVEDFEIEEVDSLEDSERGSGGFGSTGKY